MRIQCQQQQDKTVLVFDNNEKYIAFNIADLSGTDIPELFTKAMELLDEKI